MDKPLRESPCHRCLERIKAELGWAFSATLEPFGGRDALNIDALVAAAEALEIILRNP